ncbi:chemotaxis protein CheW [Methylopila sp. 73B]|uniref:chemotaxis protein CheW n=1 Tax=Methylopila sp. 73B TaxID=1120792 RepID=UPI0003808B3A|nr:chemotaxis protein CheW [Methylopila sp. 73B]
MTGASGGGRPGGSPAAAGGEIAGGLLERPLPTGYLEEWARHFAERAGEGAAEDESDARAALLFRIGDEWLALPTDHLHEVAQPRRTHSLPHRRDDLVLGIVNVRGELLVCVSLSALLGISAGAAEAGERSRAGPRLVVIGRDGHRVAFPVDEVHGVHRYSARDVVALPATIGKAVSSYAVGMIAWKGRAIGRLDDALILETLDRSMS